MNEKKLDSLPLLPTGPRWDYTFSAFVKHFIHLNRNRLNLYYSPPWEWQEAKEHKYLKTDFPLFPLCYTWEIGSWCTFFNINGRKVTPKTGIIWSNFQPERNLQSWAIHTKRLWWQRYAKINNQGISTSPQNRAKTT